MVDTQVFCFGLCFGGSSRTNANIVLRRRVDVDERWKHPSASAPAVATATAAAAAAAGAAVNSGKIWNTVVISRSPVSDMGRFHICDFLNFFRVIIDRFSVRCVTDCCISIWRCARPAVAVCQDENATRKSLL